MAKVRVQIQPHAENKIPVQLTIEATVEELNHYYQHMAPSYTLGHRLHEAVGATLRQLRQAITADVVVED